MDDGRFDALTRALSDAESRRGVLGQLIAVAGILGFASAPAAVQAKKRKNKNKNKKHGKKKSKGKNKPRQPDDSRSGEQCGAALCTSGQFCCDDQRAICCAAGDSCCNIGPGTGSCCLAPNRCGRPWGNDNAPFACCPPERQWFTATGLVRCCPTGTRSLGTGITSDDGPCCPEEKYCSNALTGGTCCGDLAPVCLDRASGRCCTADDACGAACCASVNTCADPSRSLCCPEGSTACGNGCCSADFCMHCVGDSCEWKCGECEWCNQGVCTDCGVGCCGC